MARRYNKPSVERAPRREKSRPRRRRVRQQSAFEIMERLLGRRVPMNVNGEAKQVSAIKAIMFQLMQKEMAGAARAGRILLKFQEFANRPSNKSPQLQFVENAYTRAISKSSSRSDDD